MNDNRYSLAGWLAITQAVLFPLAFVVGIIQGAIGAAAFGYKGPTLGPSDVLFILFTGFGIYTIYMFRSLLNERYNFHEIDTLITISIWWAIIFQTCSLVMKIAVVALWPVSEIMIGLIYLAFMSLSMVTIGVIDILIAIKLLKIKDTLNDLIMVFVYITMAAGILEVSILLSPIALILLPISCIILGIIFLKEKEEVEFV